MLVLLLLPVLAVSRPLPCSCRDIHQLHPATLKRIRADREHEWRASTTSLRCSLYEDDTYQCVQYREEMLLPVSELFIVEAVITSSCSLDNSLITSFLPDLFCKGFSFNFHFCVELFMVSPAVSNVWDCQVRLEDMEQKSFLGIFRLIHIPCVNENTLKACISSKYKCRDLCLITSVCRII